MCPAETWYFPSCCAIQPKMQCKRVSKGTAGPPPRTTGEPFPVHHIKSFFRPRIWEPPWLLLGRHGSHMGPWRAVATRPKSSDFEAFKILTNPGSCPANLLSQTLEQPKVDCENWGAQTQNTSNLQQSWGAEVSKRERDYRKEWCVVDFCTRHACASVERHFSECTNSTNQAGISTSHYFSLEIYSSQHFSLGISTSE